MNRQLAAIDIGSNSVRLLTCRRTADGLTERVKQVNMTRLGQAVDQTGRLSAQSMDATIAVLQQYGAQLARMNVVDCPAFATSAVRDAANRANFLARIAEKTPFQVKLLSGTEEALYGFRGAVLGLRQPLQKILVIDVGGGSTELIFGDSTGKIDFSHSFDVGAVRMTERFNLAQSSDSAQFAQITAVLNHLLDRQALAAWRNRPLTCIAIGGSATTLAAIDLALANYDGAAIQGYQMATERLLALTDQLMTTSPRDRLKIVGLPTGRADIIGAGALIIAGLMRYFNQPRLFFSDYDNLEGALLSE